jgi:hypothetical protein
VPGVFLTLTAFVAVRPDRVVERQGRGETVTSETQALQSPLNTRSSFGSSLMRLPSVRMRKNESRILSASGELGKCAADDSL